MHILFNLIYAISFLSPVLKINVDSLDAYAWQSKNSDVDYEDFPENRYLKNRPNVGIAFSGGGSLRIIYMIFYIYYSVWWKSSIIVIYLSQPISCYVLPIHNFQGGSRAYVASVAQISALNELELLGGIKYIGGISGGSFQSNI